jgi:hypothetical protein
MKYQKTLAVLAGLTFAGALSQAQIAVGDNLTISGFGDLRYDNVDSSTLDVSSFNVTEVEIDFSLSLDKISAEIHLQSLPATQNDGVELEQAFVSTDLGGFTVTAGRMLNLLGLESDEKTGLAFVDHAFPVLENLTVAGLAAPIDLNLNTTRRYNDGVRAAISQGDFSLAASITDDYSGGFNINDEDGFDELAFDVAVTYTGIENLSASVGYASSEADSVLGDASILNVHATYNLGQLTLAGEYNDIEIADEDTDSYILMGSYALNDTVTASVRHSEISDMDAEKTSIALSYIFSDNLLTRVQYTNADVSNEDEDAFHLQGILSF